MRKILRRKSQKLTLGSDLQHSDYTISTTKLLPDEVYNLIKKAKSGQNIRLIDVNNNPVNLSDVRFVYPHYFESDEITDKKEDE